MTTKPMQKMDSAEKETYAGLTVFENTPLAIGITMSTRHGLSSVFTGSMMSLATLVINGVEGGE